jgi:hypothetical protein
LILCKISINCRRKINGRKVDIYVGPEAKHYVAPKDLLTHHSKFFDRCFNGAFIEATESKLTLPEDNVEFFEIMLGYIVTGRIPNVFYTFDYDEAALEVYMQFILYVEKYDVTDAGMIVFAKLKRVLKKNPATIITLEHIETVFRAYPVNHGFQEVFTIALINGTFKGHHDVIEQAAKVPGFTEEMARQKGMYTERSWY